MIPKLIHQTWKEAQIPARWASLQQSWREHHPAWEYRLWTDLELRELLRQHYAWFLPIYDNYPQPIQRVDAARYFLMHHHGGLYVDLDFESLRPIDPLLAGKEVAFGVEPAAHLALPMARARGLTEIVCNAWIASRPGHPFWEHVFKQLVACHRLQNPLDSTGPFFLTRTLTTYPQREQVALLPAELLYPISSQESEAGAPATTGQRPRLLETAFAVHYWSGSWWREETAAGQPQKPHGEGIQGIAPEIPLWLLGQGKRLLSATLHADRCEALARSQGEPPLVSCLMVTRERAALAMRAIRCFLAQTYPRKELVILDDDPDNTLRDAVRALGDPRVVHVRERSRNRSLGTLRNLSMDHAKGDFVCQWDDDDLSHPARLMLQMAAILATRADASSLMRQQLFFPERQRLADSVQRIWESSFVCSKECMPRYPARRRGEDTKVVEQIVHERYVALLDAPLLYTYVFHGRNTFDEEHFDAHWQSSTTRYEGVAYELKLRALCSALPSEVGTELLAQALPAPSAPTSSAVSKVTSGDETMTNRQEGSVPRILILTPVKDAARFLDLHIENLRRLNYPHSRISLAFLESDSRDATYDKLSSRIPKLAEEFSRVELFKRDYQYHLSGPRWEPSIQLQRRSLLARSRNYLLSRALDNEDFVLWLDVDVTSYPEDVIEALLAADKDIVVPHCVTAPGGETFDLNTFQEKPGALRGDMSHHIQAGILQPPVGEGRTYLGELREHELVPVDGVGGTMLLIRADLHREGLIFPPFSYKLFIETEGLAAMARDMGYTCWGMPRLEIVHPPH